MSTYHTPILTSAVVDGLQVKPKNRYIDATVGGGGHMLEIVKKGGVVLGIDTDGQAIEFARAYLRSQLPAHEEGKAWRLTRGNFADIARIGKEQGFGSVQGILFDLGVSSHQLDTPNRGFSYRFDSPLDLRLDQEHGVPAYTNIKSLSEDELYEIITQFGEEERAWPIVHAIFRTRRMSAIITTKDIYDAVATVIKDKKKLTQTLSRVFQALRIYVNDEKDALLKGLQGTLGLLDTNGRLVVISFHSGEDRVVKQFMKNNMSLITKKPIIPSDMEMQQNPRARSAKVRIGQRR